MEDLDFITTLAYFLNVGVFSAVISRFSGAPISILVCCAVLYVGATPLETIGIMLTYASDYLHTEKSGKFQKDGSISEMENYPCNCPYFNFSYSLSLCRSRYFPSRIHG